MSEETASPYLEGQSLDLTIVEPFSDNLCAGPLSVTIVKTFKITQSPVAVVSFYTQSGTAHAALKLYDRRLGPQFRRIPHTAEAELEWQRYVGKGMGAPLFREIDEDKATSVLPRTPDDHYEDSWEGHAQYEGSLQHLALQYFDNEIEAYKRLADLQGTRIPTMLAHVCLTQPLSNANAEVYFRVPGILMQLVEGISLWELADSSHELKKEELESIVQSAVDTADAINDSGVILLDCRPQNVIVERTTHQPFVHDFAQCCFREDCAYNADDLNDQGYQQAVYQNGNPKAIGMVMATRLKRERGFQLNIRYRNWEP